MKIVEKLELGKYVSPRIDLDRPIYNWHAFKHSYSKDLVDRLINDFGIVGQSWILDPFCGGGTTLLACKEAGINSSGYDILPFSVFLSNVKTRDYKKNKLGNILRELEKASSIPDIFPTYDIPVMQKAFSKDVLREILIIKHKLTTLQKGKYRDFCMLALLSILGSISNTKRDGGFLRIVDKNISPNSVQEAFMQKLRVMISDVSGNNHSNNQILVNAKLKDVRKLVYKRKFDAIITSPPYPNKHDYTRIYALETILGFVDDNETLKEIRYKTIRSHVEAKRICTPKNYREPESIRSLIQMINDNGIYCERVVSMLEGYFEDMHLALKRMSDSLKLGAKAALVVSNVRFAGINIPVDELLAEIGSHVGLRPLEIWITRYRGNSSQQMKNYKRNPSRESIVIWEKYA